MKTSDIPDGPILVFLAHAKTWCTWGDPLYMPSVQTAMPAGTPNKLQRSKMNSLIRRGLVDGCPCGCQGAYEITPRGQEVADSVDRSSIDGSVWISMCTELGRCSRNR